MSDARVFVSCSYVASLASWARSFVEALTERGQKAWFGENDVAPGDSLVEAVESGLRSSDVIVIILNRETAQNPNVMFEVGAALGMNKRLIPILLGEEGDRFEWVPLLLRRYRYLTPSSPQEAADLVMQATPELREGAEDRSASTG